MYNIVDIILSLSLDNVNRTYIIRLGVARAGDLDKTYIDVALIFNMNKSR